VQVELSKKVFLFKPLNHEYNGDNYITLHSINTIDCDAPPNSLKYSDVNMKVKRMDKGIGVCSLVHNILGVIGTCWSFGMGTRTNSQVKIQDEINLHNQEKTTISVS
jgi:hypothetical protein